MEQVQLENDLNLAVYINGKPSLALTPQAVMDELITALLSELDRAIKEGGAL